MIIAGAGIIGLSCGWRLAQRGHRVTIFDARETALEASWAGAGMLAPGGEVETASPLAKMSLSSLAQYPEFIRELQEATGVTIDYQRCGAMELALTEGEADALEKRAECQRALGIPSEPATYKGSVSARFFPNDELVAPRDVTSALRAACLRAGVLIRENEAVTHIKPDGSGVRTALGEYCDDGVIVAAGAWSSNILPHGPATMPVRGHLISYDTGRNLLAHILRHDGTYLLQRRGGAIVAGSSTEQVGFNRQVDEKIVQNIHNRASRLLPPLAALAPAERWNGFRPGIADGNPAIGRIEGTAIWTAFGHYRNGILLAPETARIIANLVTEALG